MRKLNFSYYKKRKPIFCGLPIEPGVSCDRACIYCYLPDVGVGFRKPIPSPLSGKELLLALEENKFFKPNETFLPFGNICDPFHPILKEKTLEWITEIRKKYNNPIQIATKEYLNIKLCEKIFRASKGRISPLITIITIKNWKRVEPNCSTPKERLKSIKNLKEAGLEPFLFFRPFINEISSDWKSLLSKAKKSGATGIVIGKLRVTKRILENFKKLGIKNPKTNKEKMQRAISYAKKIGLLVFRKACCANAWHHNVICKCEL